MEGLELVKILNKGSAAETVRWVKEHPAKAASLIWFLIGYAGLGEKQEDRKTIPYPCSEEAYTAEQ